MRSRRWGWCGDGHAARTLCVDSTVTSPPLLLGSTEAGLIASAVLGGALVVGAIAVVPRRPARWLLWVCLLAVVGTILWLTMGLAFGDAGGTGLNLTPGQEIRRGLDRETALGLLNVFGNALMFVPVGALVAWIAWRRRVLAGAGVGLVLSLGIEVTQLGLGRVADVDDVILNTAGALLGALLAVTWRAVVGRREADYDEPAGL